MLGAIVDKILLLLTWAIIIRALISFIPHSPRQPLIKVLYEITDPILRPFQRFSFMTSGMGIDLSPLIAILVINILRSFLVQLFYRLS